MINIRKCLAVCVFLVFTISGCQRTVISQDETNNQVNLNNTELIESTPIVSPTPVASIIPSVLPTPTPSTSVTPSILPSPTPKEIENVIFKCIHSTKDDILKMLGDGYEIVYTGAEASYEGYYYKHYGITIIFDFDRDDSTVAGIQLDKNVEILGVNTGMIFSQVQDILGEAPIYEVYIEYLYENSYEIFYKINECIVLFRSFADDGSNLSISILRGLRRNVGNTHNSETGKVECFWHVDEITGELTKINLYGEMHQPIVVDKGFIEGRIISVSENLGNNQLKPCIIVATEKDGIFTIYRSMEFKDFREYRTCDDQGKGLTGIKSIECKIESSGEVSRYIIEITPTDDNGQVIKLDSFNDKNIWQIK